MNNNDVIMSCRIRLARNLHCSPSRRNFSQQPAEDELQAVRKALDDGNGYNLLRMSELTQMQRSHLVERHLCSVELTKSPYGALLIDETERISIMLNEEDHIRVQAILKGLDVSQAYELASRVDVQIESGIEYAFDSQFGYLTACPTNVGTGMRASAMVHLAGLAITGQAEGLLMNVTKLGCAVRGFYGEGSGAPGNIYQISNQHTLGLTEEDIIKSLNDIIGQIAEREMDIRQALSMKNAIELSDIANRSVGVCRYARKLSYDEAMQHISNLKLGASLDLSPVPSDTADEMLISCQPASLCINAGRRLGAEEEMVARAAMTRDILKDF